MHDTYRELKCSTDDIKQNGTSQFGKCVIIIAE